MMEEPRPKIIVIGTNSGPHKLLLETLFEGVSPVEYDLFTLPAKKSQWRSRTSALFFSQTIPSDHAYALLFTTSNMNLAELLGVRPDLVRCKKLVYFHDNQLVCPANEIKEWDCQYGLNQIMTCLAADEVIFNSHYNRTSFIDSINPFLQSQSDMKLKQLRERIEPKTNVLYFPIRFDRMPRRREENSPMASLHLIWPHSWEHEKNPALLTEVLLELNKRQVDFRASIIGDSFQSTAPDCFDGMREKLGDKLIHFGSLSRDEHLTALLAGDIVISTAGHEFYGISMLEAIYCGCLPIAPNKLVYPEFYPRENLYNTSNQLIKILYSWCRNPSIFRKHRDKFFEMFEFEQFSAQHLVPMFYAKLQLN